MSMPQFIRENIEAILGGWDRFATSIPGTEGLDQDALRDHARQILMAIAAEMESHQSGVEQIAKSEGLQSPDTADTADTAAETHAGQRFGEGFDFKEVVSEYRALRASVIRLWIASVPHPGTDTLTELTRFNEGIDQALAESTGRFADRVDEARELFMGMLGHDLRTPLQVIRQSLANLQRTGIGADQAHDIMAMIGRNTEHISGMVSDMLDVTRTQFGATLPLTPRPTDVAMVCSTVVKQLESAHSERHIELQIEGDLQGIWDANRLSQLFSNLLKNAIQHGAADSTVRVSAVGEPERVMVEVHNDGEPIPPDLLPHIFEPLVTRGGSQDRLDGASGLGLGLYIACTIVKAHHGSIRVVSSREAGTSFSVALPRNALAAGLDVQSRLAISSRSDPFSNHPAAPAKPGISEHPH